MPKLPRPTKKQADVIEAIKKRKGHATVRRVAFDLRISDQAAYRRIERLMAKGLVRKGCLEIVP